MCDTVTLTPGATTSPRWLGLYAATVPSLLALGLVEVVSPPNALRTLARCVFTLATFVGMGWWVHSSRAAMDLQQWCDCAPGTITVRVIESSRPAYPERLPERVSVPVPADEELLVSV
jgi:hypothetical protein